MLLANTVVFCQTTLLAILRFMAEAIVSTTNSDTTQSLHLIYERNEFYFLHYKKLRLVVFIQLLAILGTCGLLLFQHFMRPVPVYFPTTPDGVPIHIVRLDVEYQPEDVVMKWAVDSILQLYSFDFVNFRKELQDAQNYFTLLGHLQFMKALYDSNNLESVIANKQIVSAEVTGQPELLRKGQLSSDEPYTWDIKIPLTTTYQNSKGEVNQQEGIVYVRVARDSLLRYPNGLAVAQVIFQAS